MRDEVVKLRCPKCGRYLAEGKGYIKAVCRDCGGEASYRSKAERGSSGGIVTSLLTAS